MIYLQEIKFIILYSIKDLFQSKVNIISQINFYLFLSVEINVLIAYFYHIVLSVNVLQTKSFF